MLWVGLTWLFFEGGASLSLAPALFVQSIYSHFKPWAVYIYTRHITKKLTEGPRCRQTDVFTPFPNCPAAISVQSEDGRVCLNRGPAARKLLSPSRDWLLGTRQAQVLDGVQR